MGVYNLSVKGSAQQMTEEIKAKIAKKRAQVVLALQRQITILTPRDTGRGANSYFISQGTPSDEIIPAGVYPSISIPPPSFSLNAVPLETPLYITNNVYYLVYVNDGTKSISPRHFVEKSITVINNSLLRS
jgi:hypothetical protein